MHIRTNSASLATQTSLSKSQSALGKSIERLSSGLRINQAADDAAGQAIANRMDSRLRGDRQALRNAADAQSMLMTVDSTIEEITNAVHRVRELAVQKANGTNSLEDQNSIQQEIDEMLAEIDRMSGSLNFNGMRVGVKNSFSFQIGSEVGDTLEFDLQGISRYDIGLSKNFMTGLRGPMEAVEVDGNNTVAPNSSFPIVNESLTIEFYDSTNTITRRISGIDAIAEYYGLSPEAIRFYQRPGSGNNQYIIAIGDNYYYRSMNSVGGSGSVTPEGNYKTTLQFGRANFYVTDPDTGTRTYLGDLGTPQTSGLMMANLNGAPTRVVEYQGKYYTYSLGGNDTSSPPYEILASREVQVILPNYIDQSDAALDYLGNYRAKLGATMNRLDSIMNGLSSDTTALAAARSRIEDADYALEVSNMTRAQILQQAGQAVLAQANQIPQGVLSLIK